MFKSEHVVDVRSMKPTQTGLIEIR